MTKILRTLTVLSCLPLPCALAQELTPFERFQLTEPVVELPITLGGTQIMVDDVYVNGQGPFRFVLDTGAQGGGRVDSTLAKKLGLEAAGEVQGSDATGRGTRSMKRYRLETLEIGGAAFEGVYVASRDYNTNAIGARGLFIDGILGYALFEHLLLTIDYPARRLRIERGSLDASEGQHVVQLLQPERGVPAIKLMVEEIEQNAMIDTGAMGGIMVNKLLTDQLQLGSKPINAGSGKTLIGAIQFNQAPLLGSIHMAGHQLENPLLTISEVTKDVILGGYVLRDFALTFDQAGGLMRFERSSAAATWQDGPAKTTLGGTRITVPMAWVAGRPAVEARVNGGQAQLFVIDTGRFESSLVGGFDAGKPTQIEIGAARFEGCKVAASVPGRALDPLTEPQGILGLSLFSDCLITLDFENERVVLRRGALPRADDQQVLDFFASKDGPLNILVGFDDDQKLARLATGSSAALIAPESLQPDTITIGAHTIEDAAAQPAEASRFILGSGLLRNMQVTVDRINQRVEFVRDES